MDEFQVPKEDMQTSGEPQPLSRPHHQRPKSQNKKLLIVAVGVVGVLLLAGLLWFFVLRKPAKTTTNTNTTQNQTTQSKEETPPPADPTPVTFKSTKLNLELTHRKDWTMKEDEETGNITLTSPKATYTAADETSAPGVFTLKIRKGATDAMKETIEKAVAPVDSVIIAYKAPTESQRHYTNVSYAGLDGNFSFFIITGSTEIKAGKSFAYMLAFDSDSYVFAGGFGKDEDDAFAFDPAAKSATESETVKQAIAIIESIKLF